MKILIISASFYPKISPRSFRTTELVKELSRKGHDVDLLVPRVQKEHDAFERQFQNVKILDLGRPRWEGTNYGSSKPAVLLSRLINRLANLFFDLPLSSYYKLTETAVRNLSGYDLLITIAVPHSIHWGVAKVWKKGKENIAKTWVADCGDPFMYCDTDTFKKLPYFHFFENNFLKKADYVSVPFEDLKNFFNKKYRDKFHVIPQGFDFNEIKLAEYQKNSRPTFAFSGSVIPGIRDFFNLLDFLEENYTDFEFHIYTKQKNLFKKYLSTGNLVLHDYKPRLELLYELSKMDFLVNVDTDYSDEVRNAIPSKIIDYTLTQRPVLSFKNSALPEDTVKEFMSGNYLNRYSGIQIDDYNIENVTAKFIELAQIN